ncbi:unnamed protein product, partial [Ranitomeya imitator]
MEDSDQQLQQAQSLQQQQQPPQQQQQQQQQRQRQRHHQRKPDDQKKRSSAGTRSTRSSSHSTPRSKANMPNQSTPQTTDLIQDPIPPPEPVPVAAQDGPEGDASDRQGSSSSSDSESGGRHCFPLDEVDALVKASQVCPFLIDPSSQATEWLKTHLKESRLEVINQQDANFITALELAVRFGKTLIIQEMDGVEPVLYPILRKDLIAQGPRYVVQIGEKTIDYNEEFRLFLATRNPNPVIPPDASSIVTEVNFTTTSAGLRGQLLALTIQHEKPDLEEQKTKLLQQEEDKKIQLAKLEESLLEVSVSDGIGRYPKNIGFRRYRYPIPMQVNGTQILEGILDGSQGLKERRRTLAAVTARVRRRDPGNHTHRTRRFRYRKNIGTRYRNSDTANIGRYPTLATLATSQGNLLDNKELINSLNQTKASSALIQDSLSESHRLQISLDQERNAYLPLAESASKMYFIICDLSKINNMYCFSLAAFLRLFQRTLLSKQVSGGTELRIRALIDALKHTVYEYVCRSLFK